MNPGGKSSLRKWIIPLTAALCLVGDAISKEWARTTLVAGEPIPFMPGVSRFFLTHNTGAAFSLGAGNSYLMTALASVVTLALVAWMLKREATLVSNVERFGLGFLFGGACGNLLDRFSQGRVTDFIEFTFITFPVFNCADVCIDIGIGLILIAMMMENSAQAKEATSTHQDETSLQMENALDRNEDKPVRTDDRPQENAAQHDYHG
jgi:signal peptidase II